MNAVGKTLNDIRLSSTVTIGEYLRLEDNKDRERIADFIQERFTERYITPLRGDPLIKHGFCTMAICCLMIETLESFCRGWPNSNRQSELAFCSFFDRCPDFEVFRGYATGFYRHVRCGILHQAETTNGWRIRRKGPLFESLTKTINATEFHNVLEQQLKNYCERLKQSDWSSEIWQNFRKKMKSIISNCRTKQAE